MGAAPEGPEEAPPVPPAKPARKPRAKAKTSAKAPPAAPTPELAAPSSEIPEKAPETEEPSNPHAFGLAETSGNLADLGLAETSKNVAEEPAQTELQAEEPVEPTPKAKPKPRAPPKKREAIPAGMNLADKAFCPICRAGPMTNATLLYRHTCPKSALGAKPRAPRFDDEPYEADEELPPPPPLRRQTHDYPQLSYRETLLQQQEQQRQARMARMIAPMRSHYRIVR